MLHNLSVNPLLNFAKSHKKNIRILTFFDSNDTKIKSGFQFKNQSE